MVRLTKIHRNKNRIICEAYLEDCDTLLRLKWMKKALNCCRISFQSDMNGAKNISHRQENIFAP